MQPLSRNIIGMGLMAGWASIAYFLCLVCRLPVWAALVCVVGGLVIIVREVCIFEDTPLNRRVIGTVLSYLLMVAGIAGLAINAVDEATKYGGWDAWAIWDLKARYMAGSEGQWRHIFNAALAHPDYPLLLPGLNGLLIRLTSLNVTTVSFTVSLIVLLCIPLLIYSELYKKNLIIGGAVLCLFVFNKSFIQNGASHYADFPVAFYLLCAVICVASSKENPKNIVAAAAALGCCSWTKNEGLILTVIFLLFNFRWFFAKAHIKYTFGGIAFPLITFVVLKLAYAPPNDMVNAQNSTRLQEVFKWDNYVLITHLFLKQLNASFYAVELIFIFYVLSCAVQRKWPGRLFFMLVTCMLTYLAVYLVTPHSIEYHMSTSVERLTWQIVPALLYIMSTHFADIKMPIGILRVGHKVK